MTTGLMVQIPLPTSPSLSKTLDPNSSQCDGQCFEWQQPLLVCVNEKPLWSALWCSSSAISAVQLSLNILSIFYQYKSINQAKYYVQEMVKQSCVFTVFTPNNHSWTIMNTESNCNTLGCHTFSPTTHFAFVFLSFCCLFSFLHLPSELHHIFLWFADERPCVKSSWNDKLQGQEVVSVVLVSLPWFHTSEIHVTSLALKCKDVPMAYFHVTKYCFYCLCLLFFSQLLCELFSCLWRWSTSTATKSLEEAAVRFAPHGKYPDLDYNSPTLNSLLLCSTLR